MLVSFEVDLKLNITQVSCSNEQPSQLSPFITTALIGSDLTTLLDKIHHNLVVPFYEWATRNLHLSHFTLHQYLGVEEYIIFNAFRQEDKFSIFIDIRPQIDEKEVFEKNFKKFFFDNFEGGVLFVNSSGKIFDCTQRVLDLFKLKDPNGVLLTREAMLDKDFSTLLSMNNLLIAAMTLQKLMIKSEKSLEGFLSGDLNILNSVCQFFVTPISLKRKMIGYYVFVHDLTELREKDVLIEHQKAAIVSTSKLAALGEMAGGIAHEINNPLAIIVTTTRVMQTLFNKGKLPREEFDSRIEIIEQTVRRISHIISSLKNISRNGEGELKDQVVITDLLEDVFILCSERFKNRGVTLKLVVSENATTTKLLCDQVQISQVLINLLNNAYDAIENLEDKWVNVEVKAEAGRLLVEVMDSGSGISEQVKEKIFQPFFTTKELGKGTGIGLSISMSLVKNHRGNLYLDTAKKNTTFVIDLPFE